MKRAGGKAVNLRIRAPAPLEPYPISTQPGFLRLSLPCGYQVLPQPSTEGSAAHAEIRFSQDSPVPGLRERYFRSCAELPGVVKVGGTPEPGGRGPFHFTSEPKAIIEVVRN